MSNTAGNTTARQLGALRSDVDETTSALKITVDKLVDRQEKLNILSERADDLSMSSQHFHGSARRVQQRMKWQNYKITIFIVAVIVIVIGVIVLIAVHPWSK